MIELIERVEKATAGGHDLDDALWAMFVAPKAGMGSDPNAYTFSIDDAVTLLQWARPGSEWAISTLHDICHAEVDMNAQEPVTARAATLPLALCLATLRAMAQGGQS